MASVVKYIVMLAMFIQIAQSGALALGICQTGCNTVPRLSFRFVSKNSVNPLMHIISRVINVKKNASV